MLSVFVSHTHFAALKVTSLPSLVTKLTSLPAATRLLLAAALFLGLLVALDLLAAFLGADSLAETEVLGKVCSKN